MVTFYVVHGQVKVYVLGFMTVMHQEDLLGYIVSELIWLCKFSKVTKRWFVMVKAVLG